MRIHYWNKVFHRDLGYFTTGFIIIFCVSGVALNHIDHWNPNFIIQRRKVTLNLPTTAAAVEQTDVIRELSQLGLEHDYLSYDFPTADRIKIYLADGSITSKLAEGAGEYETIRRRPFFFRANTIHIAPKTWWRWISDMFAVLLMTVAITGLFILRGKRGLAGRGKRLVGAGLLLPLLAMLLV